MSGRVHIRVSLSSDFYFSFRARARVYVRGKGSSRRLGDVVSADVISRGDKKRALHIRKLDRDSSGLVGRVPLGRANYRAADERV